MDKSAAVDFYRRLRSQVQFQLSPFPTLESVFIKPIDVNAFYCSLTSLAWFAEVLIKTIAEEIMRAKFCDHPVNDDRLKLWMHHHRFYQTQEFRIFTAPSFRLHASLGSQAGRNDWKRHANLTHKCMGCRSAALVFSILSVSMGHRVSCSVDRVRHGMADNEGLTDLLSQKFYLSKILIYLVDSGLHECRRVCRVWYEVCNQLPVKLSLPLDANIIAVSDIFPKAVAVSLEVEEEAADEDGNFVEGLLGSCMSSLSNLTHLALTRSVQWPLLLNELGPGSESLQSLLSLSVDVSNLRDHSDLLEFLKFLTGLTALTVTGEPRFVQNTKPIPEIRNLKSLTVGLPLLVTRNGQLIFAASTQLTRLDVISTTHFDRFNIPLLQASPSHRLNACVISTVCVDHASLRVDIAVLVSNGNGAVRWDEFGNVLPPKDACSGGRSYWNKLSLLCTRRHAFAGRSVHHRRVVL